MMKKYSDENIIKLQEAVEAVQSGNKDAFQEIYHMTYQKTYKIARGFFPSNEQDRDDCIQTIYMHLYKKIGLYQKKNGNFIPWFCVVAENVCKNEYARIMKKKGTEVSLDNMKAKNDGEESAVFEDEDLTYNPEAHADREETRRLVNEIVSGLPEALRQTVMLYYSGEYKQEDVANLLGVSLPAVKKRLRKAKELIADHVVKLQKQGVKLFSMSPVTYFAWLLANDAELDAEAAAHVPFHSDNLVNDTVERINGGNRNVKYLQDSISKNGDNLLMQAAGKAGSTAKLKAWATAHVKLIISVVSCSVAMGAVGAVIYGSTKQDVPETVPEVQVAAPLIHIYSDKIYAGVGQEISVQDEIVRSVISYGDEAEVSITCEDATIEEGNGSIKNGVPDIRITFGESGEYDVAITAAAEDVSEKSVHVSVTGELAAYVKGIHDWNIEAGAEDIDLMAGVEWDTAYIKDVTLDTGKADFSKAGNYKVIYTVIPVAENQENEKIEATVHVLSKKDVVKKAELGETVVANGNETIEPIAVTAEKPKTAETKKEPSSVIKKEPTKSPADTSVKEEKPDQPTEHTHNWQERTETINHPEESHIEYIEHPAEGHTETKTIPEQYHYEQRWVYQCNGCKVKYYTDAEIGAHMEEQMIAGNIACGGYSSFMEQEKVIDAPERSEEVWVEDKAAWTEEKKVVDKKAWTETKTYYVCSCGARKE